MWFAPPTHRLLGLARMRWSASASASASPAREGAVDLDHRRAELRIIAAKLRVRHEGAVEHEDLGLAVVLVEHVLEVAEPRLEAHHPVLAQAVDRRVRHLGEVLPEVVAERPVAVRQHRGRRVVAHRADRLLAVLGHRREDRLELLDGVARRDLPPPQLRTRRTSPASRRPCPSPPRGR
jgi:hypothetical protein